MVEAAAEPEDPVAFRLGFDEETLDGLPEEGLQDRRRVVVVVGAWNQNDFGSNLMVS